MCSVVYHLWILYNSRTEANYTVNFFCLTLFQLVYPRFVFFQFICQFGYNYIQQFAHAADIFQFTCPFGHEDSKRVLPEEHNFNSRTQYPFGCDLHGTKTTILNYVFNSRTHLSATISVERTSLFQLTHPFGCDLSVIGMAKNRLNFNSRTLLCEINGKIERGEGMKFSIHVPTLARYALYY